MAGVSGELIVVHPNAYYRTYGQSVYTEADDSTLWLNPSSNSNSANLIVNNLLKAAVGKDLNPQLIGTENEPSGPAYHVRVEITKAVANDTLGAIGSVFGAGTLDVWVTADSHNWLERMEYRQADQTSGQAAIRLTLSHWNDIPAINVPPAVQLATPQPEASAS